MDEKVNSNVPYKDHRIFLHLLKHDRVFIEEFIASKVDDLSTQHTMEVGMILM